MNPWDQLDFLIGNWSSPLSGQPGEGVSGFSSFSYQLDHKVIVRKSRAEFAPEPGQEMGLVHDDLLVIYKQPDETQLRAIYFDNEGHIIHYTLFFPARQHSVTFESESNSTSPQARLVYEEAPNGTLSTEFFVALPGGQLLSHVKGILVREKQP